MKVSGKARPTIGPGEKKIARFILFRPINPGFWARLTRSPAIFLVSFSAVPVDLCIPGTLSHK